MKEIFMIIIFYSLTICSSYSQDYKVIGHVEDLKLIQLDNKIGLMNYHDKIVIPLSNFNKIEYDKTTEYYKCFINNEFQLYTRNGILIESDYLFTDISNAPSSSFREEEWQVTSTQGIGRISKNKVIIPPIYDKIIDEMESYFQCCGTSIVVKKGKKGMYLNNALIFPVTFDNFYKFKKTNAFIVEKNGKKGLYRGVNYGYDGYKELLPIEYDEVIIKGKESFGERTLFIVKKEKLVGVFDEKNKFIIPLEYKKIDWDNKEDLDNNLTKFNVQKNKIKGILIVDLWTEYTPIFLLSFKPIGEYSNILIYENEMGMFGLVDLSILGKDKLILPTEYEEIRIHNDSSYAVNKNGKWGVVNLRNEIIVEFKFQNIQDLEIE